MKNTADEVFQVKYMYEEIHFFLKALCIHIYLKRIHNMTAWNGKMIDCVHRKYFGGCIDRLPWLQNARESSIFFLTNEAGTAFRWHVR